MGEKHHCLRVWGSGEVRSLPEWSPGRQCWGTGGGMQGVAAPQPWLRWLSGVRCACAPSVQGWLFSFLFFWRRDGGGIGGDILHVLSGGLDFNFLCIGCHNSGMIKETDPWCSFKMYKCLFKIKKKKGGKGKKAFIVIWMSFVWVSRISHRERGILTTEMHRDKRFSAFYAIKTF